MNIWRINIKPNSEIGIDPRKLCIENEIVGVGWQIESKDKTVTWKDYEQKASKKYFEQQNWKKAINAIHNRIKIDDLIWTRDSDGIYYVGRIISDWYYKTSEEFKKADIVNVRKCNWQKVGTIESVPGKIVNSFFRGTVQRINDNTTNLFSRYIYNKKSKHNFYSISDFKNMDIYSLLGSDDCEDILGLYLQYKEDYLLIPSSCKSSTMKYEYELIGKRNGEKAVVQVKNGVVDLISKNYFNFEGKVYLFTTKGKYEGKSKENIIFIDPKEMENFIFANERIMPSKIKSWIEIYSLLKSKNNS